MTQNKTRNIWLWIILALGFTLRLWGIGFGLPHLYHADEPALVNHALAHGTGDLNPHYFKLPPFLNYYLLFFYALYFLLGRLLGWFPDQGAYLSSFLQDPTPFYLIGRCLTGLFWGTLGLYLVYRLGRKILGERGALLATFFLSLSFLHVRDSHYVIYDIPLTTALSFCSILLFNLLEKQRRADFLLFGFFAGLTVTVKYNGALILVPFALLFGQQLCRKRTPLRQIICHPMIWILGGGVLLGYILGNPFSFLDFKTFIRELTTQASNEGGVGLFHHLRYSLAEGIGVPLLLMGLWGSALFLKSTDLKQKAVALFVFTWILAIGVFSQPYERYALPVVPFLCLGAASVVEIYVERLKVPFRKSVFVTTVLLVTVIPAASSAYADLLFSRQDVRTLAKEWVETHLPPGSKIALDYTFHAPRLHFNKEQLQEKYEELGGGHSELNRTRLDLLLKNQDTKIPAFRLYFLDDGNPAARPLFSRPVLPFDWRALRRHKVDYLIITRLTPQYEHPDFYRQVASRGHLVKRFTPFRDPNRHYGIARWRQAAAATEAEDLFARERLGDILEIYRLR